MENGHPRCRLIDFEFCKVTYDITDSFWKEASDTFKKPTIDEVQAANGQIKRKIQYELTNAYRELKRKHKS